jgi:tetratricopeptide (TPR) repeat protein
MTTSKLSQIARLGFSLGLLALLVIGCQQEVISSNPKARATGIKEFGQGNYADAAGSFRNAVRSDPRDYVSQYYLGQSYEQMKQYQQSIQAYKASLDAQPRTLAGREDQTQRLRTIEALASVISKSDQRDAEVNAVEAAAKQSNKAQDWLLFAKIAQNRGDVDTALDSYNRASLAEPGDFVVAKLSGLYLEQVGQKKKAEQALRRAYSIKSTDQEVNEALRRLNVVPGPGLKDENALVKPPVPVGPIPQVDWNKLTGREAQAEPAQAEPARATEQPTYVPPPPTGSVPAANERAVSAPRD